MTHKLLLYLSIPTLISSASAVTVAIDYSDSSSGFFDTGTSDGVTARAAVQAAADDISAAITSSLGAVSNYSHVGNNGSSSVTITANLGYTNPDTGGSETFSGSLAADEIRIFAGARALGGSTLGQGGPGSSGISVGASGFPSEFQGAADAASASFTSELGRGSPIIVSSFSGDIGGASYSATFGPTLGNLWFDNDGSSDFHLDHTTPVVAGKSDLYSVALHEILHSIGIGTFDSWDAQVSGVDWTGAEVIALNGTGTGIIDSGGGHIAASIMSTRLSDGVAQEVVMDPNITVGTRKELTHLDLAFLRDIGYTTVPEPSSTLLLGLGSLSLIMRRRK